LAGIAVRPPSWGVGTRRGLQRYPASHLLGAFSRRRQRLRSLVTIFVNCGGILASIAGITRSLANTKTLEGLAIVMVV